MNLKDPKIQRLMVVLLLVGALGYVYFGSSFFSFCYQVRKARIQAMEAEYSQLSAELEKARKTVSSLAALEAEYLRLHEQWLSATELLPEEKEMPDLLRQVTTAGSKGGIEFMLFQPMPSVPNEFYTSHPIKVRVRGGYHHLGIFLSRLANMERIVNVGDLAVKASTQGTGKDKEKKIDLQNSTVVADFTLTAYTLLGGVEHETSK
ncbi:MAG: type 4a pilus biogenesis protein PilO [Chitinivibrionia bacterium]|nr:type 4a pilus biogenesis protein PilO [Chitinivibrionia bacterium]